jgi:hypothetical protein
MGNSISRNENLSRFETGLSRSGRTPLAIFSKGKHQMKNPLTPGPADDARNDLTPSEYETLVAKIVSGIAVGAPELAAGQINFGARNRVLGASGYRHQIDVSLLLPKQIYIVECKRWLKRIGVQEALILASRGLDILEANPGFQVHAMIASTVRITAGAKLIATKFGVQPEIVKSEFEFGFRIGRRVYHALRSTVVVGDYAEAMVVRAKPDQAPTNE